MEIYLPIIITSRQEIGKLMIMFFAGLEIDLKQFAQSRNRSAVFGLLTFSIPLAIGMTVGRAFDYSWNASLLLGSLMASHTLLSLPIAEKLAAGFELRNYPSTKGLRSFLLPPNRADYYLPLLWTLFLFIMVCNLLGMFPFSGFFSKDEIIHSAFHGGSTGRIVLGMVLLLGALLVRGGVPEGIGAAADGLARHLSLLFIPAGVGVILYLDRLAGEWAAVAVAVVASTVAAIAATAITFAFMLKRSDRTETREP